MCNDDDRKIIFTYNHESKKASMYTWEFVDLYAKEMGKNRICINFEVARTRAPEEIFIIVELIVLMSFLGLLGRSSIILKQLFLLSAVPPYFNF